MKNIAQGKDILYLALVENIKEGGCPICTYLDQSQRKRIEAILYELVNDLKTREKFSESLGLCPYHAWLLNNIALSDPLYGKLGPAIIYHHMLSEYFERLSQGSLENFEQTNSKCFLCKELFEEEKDIVDTFVEKLVTTDLLKVYINSPHSILCPRHYQMVYNKLNNIEKRKELEKTQINKVKYILENLASFISKHNYNSKENFTKEEALSLKLAIEALKGKPLITGYRHICYNKHSKNKISKIFKRKLS